MILVTGTERSGASLWMQILAAAGFPVLGEGPAGSHFRNGIYYATNPNADTGEYLLPEQVEHHAVKVRIPGLVRTDRAYIGRVIAMVRDHREYVASTEALHAVEDVATQEAPKTRLPAWLTWWGENYALVRDIAMRRYAVHVETHGRLVSEPERVIREVFAWVGRGDADAAVERVRPEPRAFDRPNVDGVPPEVAEVFDALYAAIETRAGLTAALIQRLNETHQALLPRILAFTKTPG